jgi:hypothetical protein
MKHDVNLYIETPSISKFFICLDSLFRVKFRRGIPLQKGIYLSLSRVLKICLLSRPPHLLLQSIVTELERARMYGQYLAAPYQNSTIHADDPARLICIGIHSQITLTELEVIEKMDQPGPAGLLPAGK